MKKQNTSKKQITKIIDLKEAIDQVTLLEE